MGAAWLPEHVRYWVLLLDGSSVMTTSMYLSVAHSQEHGHEVFEQFVTGYTLELCLSLDNLFAFYMVFRYFKLKDGAAQTRVLRWGIMGSIMLRALMVSR